MADKIKTNMFGGYNQRAVDSLVQEMHDKYEATKQEALQAVWRNQELQTDLNQKDEELRIANRALLNTTAYYEAAVQKIAEYEKKLSNVGQIYMYAYDSASAIANRSKQETENFMERVSAESEIASVHAETIVDEMTRMKTEMQRIIADMEDKTEYINVLIDNFIQQAKAVPAAFTQINLVKTQLQETINREMQHYTQAASGFLTKNASKKPEELYLPDQKTNANPVEPDKESIPIKDNIQQTNGTSVMDKAPWDTILSIEDYKQAFSEPTGLSIEEANTFADEPDDEPIISLDNNTVATAEAVEIMQQPVLQTQQPVQNEPLTQPTAQPLNQRQKAANVKEMLNRYSQLR